MPLRNWLRFWTVVALVGPLLLLSLSEIARAQMEWRYKCIKCGADLGPIGGPPPQFCPVCGGMGKQPPTPAVTPPKVPPVLSAPSVIFLAVLMIGLAVVGGAVIGIVLLLRAIATAGPRPRRLRRPRRRDRDDEDD